MVRGFVAPIAFAGVVTFACADTRSRSSLDADAIVPDPSVPRLARATPRRAFPTDGIEVVISRDRVSVGGVRVASIADGRLPADEVAHHHVAGLAQQLRTTTATSPVVIHADELTRFGAVVDAMYTAHGIGRDELAIAVAPVAPNGSAGVITVNAPRTWDHDLDDRVEDHACVSVAQVGDATVMLTTCDGVSRRFAIEDAAGMQGHTASLGANIVRVTADADVGWSTIVRVIDALGGPPWDHAAIEARTIRAHHVVLDLDPPIPWRAGRWDALEVRLDHVELIEHADRVRDRAQLEARATAIIPALQRCLRGSDALRLRVPDHLSIVLATHPELGDVAFTDERTAPACATALVAVLPPRIVEVVPGDAVLHFAIDVPPE